MKVSDYHKLGFNCAEAMIKTYNEEHDTDIPVALGSGMGAGFTTGSLCGAIAAANIIIGYLKGREISSDKNEARSYTRELMSAIREKYNTHICRDLKRQGVTCAEIEDFTYEALKKILNK